MTDSEFAQLISLYESSLTPETKKAKGIFYTDLALADKIIEELDIPADAIVLDPCCGIGSFNYAAARRGIRQVCGADIDKSAIEFCRVMFPDGRFIHSDSIEQIPGSTLARLGIPGKADYVIGNPPYAKWNPTATVSPSFNAKVTKSGNNTFSAALMRALDMAREHGYVSYIIPKNFLHVSAYGPLRKEILTTKTIVSIIDIGAYFRKVRGEQIILTIQNTLPTCDTMFFIKKMIGDRFKTLTTVRQCEFDDEIILFANSTDLGIYNKLKAFPMLETVIPERVRRGRQLSDAAISGKDIRKFGFKDHRTSDRGNRIFIQNIYSSEAGIMAAFGGDLEASETVTVLTAGNERMCRFLLGLLHSQVCNFFLFRYCYNYSRLTMHTDAKYLNKLPVPIPTDETIDRITACVTKLESAAYMSDEWFAQMNVLDDIVYDIYNLTTAERTFIGTEMRLIHSPKWHPLYI